MIDQELFACRLLWGRNGLAEALRRRDILVVVDVLRFTSTAITAVSRGVEIAVAAFRVARADLPDIVARCSSGQELFERGQSADVAHCARLDSIPIAARLERGRIVRVGQDRSSRSAAGRPGESSEFIWPIAVVVSRVLGRKATSSITGSSRAQEVGRRWSTVRWSGRFFPFPEPSRLPP